MFARPLSLYKHSFTGFSKEVWLLSLVSFINRSGTMVVAFLTIYLTDHQGFTLEQAGWGMTTFGVGAVIGSYLGGKLTDKIGFYKVQFWSLFLGGALFILLQWISGFWGILAMILLLSTIGEAFRPATMTSIAVYSQPENRTRSYSLLRMAINVGWSIGPAVGGWMAAVYGYHALFWADGLTCIAAALVFRSFITEKRKSDDEAHINEDAPSRSPWQDRMYLIFLGLIVLGATAFMQFLSALPVFYKQDLHLSEAEIGALLALNGVIVFIMEMPTVYVLERKFTRFTNMALGVALYGIAYLMLNLPGASVGIAVISMISLSVGEIFNMPFANSFAMARTVPSNRGRYMGLYSMSWSVAHIIGPALGMQIAARWGFGVLWYVLGGLCLLSYAGFMQLKKSD